MPDQLRFEPVVGEQDIARLARVAREIWNEYWPALIGQDQTDYMVESFLSEPALTDELTNHNYRFWFIYDPAGELVGFTGGATEELCGDPALDTYISHSAVVDRNWPRRFFISKVYLYRSARGKHYASRIMEMYARLCQNEGIPAMYLTVNRGNELGIHAYLALGFKTVEDVDAEIGHGFVMDDHIMVREISVDSSS